MFYCLFLFMVFRVLVIKFLILGLFGVSRRWWKVENVNWGCYGVCCVVFVVFIVVSNVVVFEKDVVGLFFIISGNCYILC